jgi:hypothetical protein
MDKTELATTYLIHAWESLESNPLFSLACTDRVIANYAEAERNDNLTELEPMKLFYEEAIILRESIQTPKVSL